MKLLTSQKDEIFERIQLGGYFSPSQFEFINELNKASMLKFINSDFFFHFRFDNYGTFLTYSPGEESLVESTGNLNWSSICQAFSMWLVYLEREVTAPDYWSGLKNQLSGLTFVNQYDNEKFSVLEYEDLQNRIEGLKFRLEKIPLILEHQKEIINHLDRLSEQAKELGKFDWKSLFIGTMISLFIQLGISQENISALWGLIKSTFSNYFLE
jgi:hypothetical protein